MRRSPTAAVIRFFSSRNLHPCAFSGTPRLSMALHPPAPTDKLIFAPAGASTNTAAPQFTLGSLSRSQLDPNPLTQFTTWFALAQTSPSAGQKGTPTPETCCLSTASLPSGRVSSRFVYLKEVLPPSTTHPAGGFVIYTNLGTSRKARDLKTNQYASLAFWWKEMERQVRVEGRVEKLKEEETEEYWTLRERGSKVGAWGSRQSQTLSSVSARELSSANGNAVEGEKEQEKDGREVLEQWVAEAGERFKDLGDQEIPVPSKEWWGGIRIVPERIEFWQGRQSRLHDRFVYIRKDVKESEVKGVEVEETKGWEDGVKLDLKGEEVEWVVERLSP